MHLLTLSKIFGINSDLMEFFSFVITSMLTAFVGFFEMGLHTSCVSAHFPFSIKFLLEKIKIKICRSNFYFYLKKKIKKKIDLQIFIFIFTSKFFFFFTCRSSDDRTF